MSVFRSYPSRLLLECRRFSALDVTTRPIRVFEFVGQTSQKRTPRTLSFTLCSSVAVSSSPSYRWSHAAFNNPTRGHASRPQATPLMLHTHTTTHGGSASSLGWTPVYVAQIGSVWFSMEQQHWALGVYTDLQGPTFK